MSLASGAPLQRDARSETAPECFTRLHGLVSAVATLDHLADVVKAGNVYLSYNPHRNTFYPVTKRDAELFGAAIQVIKGNGPVDLSADLAVSTARALQLLLRRIDRGHELVQALEKHCNDLKSGGGSTGGSDAAFLAGSYTTNFRGDVTHGQAHISVSGKTVTVTNQSGETATATYGSGTLTVTGGWPDTTPSHPLVAQVTQSGGAVRIEWPLLLDGKSGGFWVKET